MIAKRTQRIALSKRVAKDMGYDHKEFAGAYIDDEGKQVICGRYFVVRYNEVVEDCIKAETKSTHPFITKMFSDGHLYASDFTTTINCTKVLANLKKLKKNDILYVETRDYQGEPSKVYFKADYLKQIIATLKGEATIIPQHSEYQAVMQLLITAKNGEALLCPLRFTPNNNTAVIPQKPINIKEVMWNE